MGVITCSPNAFVVAKEAARKRPTWQLLDIDEVFRRLLREGVLGERAGGALVAVRAELRMRGVEPPSLLPELQAQEGHL
jgi:hypothetical protein